MNVDIDALNRPVMATPAGRPGPDPVFLDEESAAWVRALRPGGPCFEQACVRLHARLLRVAFAEANRRGPRFHITGPELDDLAHQAAADALMRIAERVGQFRGESRFTTWAYKFVILEMSTKLGRHFRGTVPTALTADEWQRLPDRLAADPAREVEARELVEELAKATENALTAHQRRVFVALAVNGIPLEALAAQLGMKRNALYKTMFDARRKLRAHLVANGYLPDAAPRGSRATRAE